MSLTRLEISNVRNLHSVQLDLHPGFNLVVGANGDGKTSVLESIHFLSAARTFRGQQVSPLIRHNEASCLVRGKVGPHWLAVQRDRRGGREIRIDSESIHKSSELAAMLPALVIRPESIEAITGPPGGRRRLLNWGVFHVEHSYSGEWQTANRALQQRNSLLREGRSRTPEFETWTQQLCEITLQLDEKRAAYAHRLARLFVERCESAGRLKNVECRYSRGWPEETALEAVYKSDLESDERRGFTQRGFHRADLKILVDGKDAATSCSRGELKILSWTLSMCQGLLEGELPRLLYLIDDLAAEFDADHRAEFCQTLRETGRQVVMTAIDSSQILNDWGATSGKMFHVKQGALISEGDV